MTYTQGREYVKGESSVKTGKIRASQGMPKNARKPP
jgi:hypothetical protein